MKDLMAKFKLRTMDDRYAAGSSAAAPSREIPGEAARHFRFCVCVQ